MEHSDEEKKAIKTIETRTQRLLKELEVEKIDMIDEPKIAYLMQEIQANKTILNLIEKQQEEIQGLKNDLEHDGLAHKYLNLIATSIPKEIIREKIKGLKERIRNLHPASDCVIIDDLENQIKAYEELLGE